MKNVILYYLIAKLEVGSICLKRKQERIKNEKDDDRTERNQTKRAAIGQAFAF